MENKEFAEELENRTRKFAVRIINSCYAKEKEKEIKND